MIAQFLYHPAGIGLHRVVDHDFLTVGAAAPLQEAGATALKVESGYYDRLAREYQQRRDFMVGALEESGFRVWKPSGAYYIMADISTVTDLDDVAFAEHLVKEYGIAVVPGSSFYRRPELGRKIIRFAFCKTMELLEEASERLLRLRHL